MTPTDLAIARYNDIVANREARKREVAKRVAENWRQRHPPGAIYTLDCPPVGIPPQDAA